MRPKIGPLVLLVEVVRCALTVVAKRASLDKVKSSPQRGVSSAEPSSAECAPLWLKVLCLLPRSGRGSPLLMAAADAAPAPPTAPTSAKQPPTSAEDDRISNLQQEVRLGKPRAQAVSKQLQLLNEINGDQSDQNQTRIR